MSVGYLIGLVNKLPFEGALRTCIVLHRHTPKRFYFAYCFDSNKLTEKVKELEKRYGLDMSNILDRAEGIKSFSTVTIAIDKVSLIGEASFCSKKDPWCRRYGRLLASKRLIDKVKGPKRVKMVLSGNTVYFLNKVKPHHNLGWEEEKIVDSRTKDMRREIRDLTETLIKT